MNITTVMHKGTKWIDPEMSVAQIAALMKEQDIGALPVGENDRLIGMVTDRDLALRALGRGKDPPPRPARDGLTNGIIYCRTDQPLEDAIHLMEEKQVRRLPVIDENKRMVGMLALGDISHHVSRELCGELIHAVAAPH